MNISNFFAGAFVGLIAGILLAPDKGVNTRENLANTADKWREKINEIIGKSEAGLDDLRSYLEQDISGLNEDVRNRILTILDEAEEMAYSPEIKTNSISGDIA